MISIQNVFAGYGAKIVLHDVTVELQGGNFLGLIGPNGSGKTTLLRLASGVLPARRGSVRLRGDNLHEVARREIARIMAFLPQDIALTFAFTVREVVLMGRSPHLSRFVQESREDMKIVDRAMELAGIAHLADRIVSEISGGERQRAFIAMCLAQQPEVLLLDEPTNHLDIAHQLSILDLIRTLNRERGMTVVSVFHDLNLAAEYCEKVVVMNDGRVVAFGTPEETLTAEMIRNVFGAEVVTQRNPVSDKPHVVVSAGMNR